MNKSKSWVIGILILAVIVLALIVIYLLAVKPAISGYAVGAYNIGVEDVILTIAQRAANCQTVPLTVGNTTINLVSVDCVNQALQQ